jgi:hypothetical protein
MTLGPCIYHKSYEKRRGEGFLTIKGIYGPCACSRRISGCISHALNWNLQLPHNQQSAAIVVVVEVNFFRVNLIPRFQFPLEPLNLLARLF